MINSMAIRDFWDFEHYGCWCIEKKGYGPAVDEVDFACLGIYRLRFEGTMMLVTHVVEEIC